MPSKNLFSQLRNLPTNILPSGNPRIEDFGILIEMHQDNDGAIKTFRHSFIRGECAPIKVHLDLAHWTLVNDDGDEIPVDYGRMRFMTVAGWSEFMMRYIMENGGMPQNSTGSMPTKLLRDARASRNLLKSFRQVAVHRATMGVGSSSHP